MSAEPTPTRPPREESEDERLLAVFRGRRFDVLPLAAVDGEVRAPVPLGGEPGELVFELRRRGDLLHARQRGTAEAGLELRHLRAWASGRGCELAIGCPLPPLPADPRLAL